MVIVNCIFTNLAVWFDNQNRSSVQYTEIDDLCKSNSEEMIQFSIVALSVGSHREHHVKIQSGNNVYIVKTEVHRIASLMALLLGVAGLAGIMVLDIFYWHSAAISGHGVEKWPRGPKNALTGPESPDRLRRAVSPPQSNVFAGQASGSA